MPETKSGLEVIPLIAKNARTYSPLLQRQWTDPFADAVARTSPTVRLLSRPSQQAQLVGALAG